MINRIIKFYTIFLITTSCTSLWGQESLDENIIYANSTKNVTLIFSNPIKKGVSGSEHFKFGYNKLEPSRIGILKASFGEESNLLVLTENGDLYSFIIRYSKDLKVLNHFISVNMSVGNERGSVSKNQIKKNVIVDKMEIDDAPVEEITVNNYDNVPLRDSINIYDKLCVNEVKKPVFFKRIYTSKNDILLSFKNITYLNNEIYITLRIQNKSTLDYDIDYLNFYIASRNKNKNTTSQTIPYKPKYIYNFKPSIKNGEYLDVIYVYQKFTINENKILLVELTEQNGERNLQLEILNTIINNPNK